MIPVKTYRDLKRMLDSMTEAQLDCEIVQYDTQYNEYFSAELFLVFADETDALEAGHPYFDYGFYQIAPKWES